MLRLTYSLLIPAVLCSCTSKDVAENEEHVPVDSTSLLRGDTQSPTIHKETQGSLQTPTDRFIDITDFLDSCGFIPDTARVKKVPYYWVFLRTNRIEVTQGRPFYLMDTISNPVFTFLNMQNPAMDYWERPNKGALLDSLCLSFLTQRIFHNVESVLGYYFRDKSLPSLDFNGLTTDGFIEEWKFSNESEAIKVEMALNGGNYPLYRFIYFNSICNLVRSKNHLYLMYSRSSWADREINKLFEDIVKKVGTTTAKF